MANRMLVGRRFFDGGLVVIDAISCRRRRVLREDFSTAVFVGFLAAVERDARAAFDRISAAGS